MESKKGLLVCMLFSGPCLALWRRPGHPVASLAPATFLQQCYCWCNIQLVYFLNRLSVQWSNPFWPTIHFCYSCPANLLRPTLCWFGAVLPTASSPEHPCPITQRSPGSHQWPICRAQEHVLIPFETPKSERWGNMSGQFRFSLPKCFTLYIHRVLEDMRQKVPLSLHIQTHPWPQP